MKKYRLLWVFLLSALGMQAYYEPDVNAYHESYVIYATIVTNENYDLSAYEIGAFIGDECRGYATSESTSEGGPAITYFPIRVFGDASADAGKEITFKAYNQQTVKEYTLTPQSTVTWSSEGTIGELSNLFQLTLSVATSMSLPETIEVELGSTVNLRDYITVTPEGASLPQGKLPWVIGDVSSTSPTEASIDDNDVLTALEVTSGISLKIMDASGAILASTTLIITNHATSLTIKDEYKDGVTVDKNDSQALTGIVRNCLVIEPENATDDVVWVIGDETIISPPSPGAVANQYTPIAGGNTTMTAQILDEEGNVRLSAVLNVTVVVPVESITVDFNANSMLANVGDNVYSRLPQVIVLPEDATNKNYTWSSDDNTIISVNGENLMALKEGFTDLRVTSEENPDLTASFGVNVVNQAKTIDVSQQIINVVREGSNLDISDLIIDNITFGPQEYTSIVGDIASSDNTIVLIDYSNVSLDEIALAATAMKEGTATITVTLKYNDFSNQPADFYPENEPNTTVTKTFTVNVTEGLTGFEVNVAEAKKGETSAITITPVPENATFDASKVTVEVQGPAEMPDGWTFATVSSQNDGKNFTVTPNLPGQALVTVLYDGQPISEQEMEVGMPINLTSGWQWRSFPYVTIGSGQMNTVFGNELEEIRSQDKLLYNDSQYGYFGTLYESGLNPYEGYKVKMKSNREYTMMGCSLNLEGDETSLSPGWNWIFNPYFYDRRIAEVLNGTFNEGDRLVSKNDGFAEYTGGKWTGTLTVLRAGEGYLFYNAGSGESELNYKPEITMAQENAAAGAKQMGMRAEWDYDASEFDGNMNMVALISSVANMEDYVIGAYVGDECRGEGITVEGKLFITVHGKVGERVNFIAHNEATNEFFPIAETVSLQTSLGTVNHPFSLNINGGSTGIDSIRAEMLKGAKSWNLQGIEMPATTPQKGVRIIRTADGKTIKTTK